MGFKDPIRKREYLREWYAQNREAELARHKRRHADNVNDCKGRLRQATARLSRERYTMFGQYKLEKGCQYVRNDGVGLWLPGTSCGASVRSLTRHREVFRYQ